VSPAPKDLLKAGKTVLKLFVAGMSPRSMTAIENVRNLCDQFLKDHYVLEIIDLYKHPELASEHQIIFSPSLIRTNPLPKKTMVGNFADFDLMLKTLGIQSKDK